MLSLKLGLSAMGLELGAWSTLTLLEQHSDAALASYLLLHGTASALLALTLLPFMHPRLAQPRWAAWLLIWACSYAVPIAGFLGVIAAFLVLSLHRKARSKADFSTLETPEYDLHQKRHNNLRHIGLGSFLANPKAPLQARMRAMAALQYVDGRTASPLLRTAMGDASEDLRLLAYGMLDNLEKRINHTIDGQLQLLQTAQANRDQTQIHECARQLADLYWELVYQNLVQGDLRQHACTQALHYCEQVLAQQPDNGALVLRKGRLLHTQGQFSAAQAAYAQARALGLPATRVLPYEAELSFAQRDYAQTQALMQQLGAWGALPRLRPVIEYWKHRA